MKCFLNATILLFSIVISVSAENEKFDWTTTAEKSNYHQTSTYDEVKMWVEESAASSPYIFMSKFADSAEGRSIPLIIIGPKGVFDPISMRARGMNSILVMANIHAGEVEGKEACLMVLRDMVRQMPMIWLKDQVILMIPIFNPDGNDKFSPNNRGDDGPDQAGVRHNGQFLDLNRDYLKVDSPEVNGLIKLFHYWDPILFLDMHTTNGSEHQHPVTYSTASNPNNDLILMDYMWKSLFPTIQKNMKDKYGYEIIPYGNFEDWQNPGKGGWINDTFEARYGTNYYGLWNRFTILNENYSHVDFKTRVGGAYAFLRSVLDYSSNHIQDMARLTREADLRAIDIKGNETFVIEYSIARLFDFTIKSYVFSKEKIKPEDQNKYPPWIKDYIVKKTDLLKDYQLPYLAKAASKKERTLPFGYILLPHRPEALRRLMVHGIKCFALTENKTTKVETFKMTSVKVGERLYQGNAPITVEGTYQEMNNYTIPKGAIFIPINQRLRRLIPILLEPDHPDSLVSWGTFNRELVGQWSNQPQEIPVLRILDHIPFRMELLSELTQ